MKKLVVILKWLVIKILLINIFFVFFCNTVFASKIVVVYPQPNSVITNKNTHIIGYSDIKTIITMKNGNKKYRISHFQKLKTKDGMKYVFMQKITLKEGKNTISFALKEKTYKFNINYVSPMKMFKTKNKKKTYFHMDENKSLCKNCHNFGKISDCQTCHQNKMQYKYVHGPAAAWQCFECHDKNNYYSPKQPISSKCLQCHDEFQNAMFSAPYAHGPTVAGYCNICHDPHGSDMKYLLTDKINNLCNNCHTDKKSGVHVLANFTSAAHPTSGKVIEKTNEEISCVSCHNPHYGQTRQLFQNNSKDFMELCISCHKDKI